MVALISFEIIIRRVLCCYIFMGTETVSQPAGKGVDRVGGLTMSGSKSEGGVDWSAWWWLCVLEI